MAENNFEAAPEGGIRVAGSGDAAQAPAEQVAAPQEEVKPEDTQESAPEAEEVKPDEESSDAEKPGEGEETE